MPPADDAERLRAYEAVVEKISNNNINNAEARLEELDDNSKQLIVRLVAELGQQKTDFVYLVNCLQLIADLACTRQGLSLLEQLDVPRKLIDILEQDDPLVVPHVLKYFCRIYPTDLAAKYERVLDKIFHYFQSDNNQLLVNAIDFLAVLGRAGYSARLMLNERCPLFKQNCLTRLGSLLSCSDESVKVRVLQCIVDLCEQHDDDPQEESSELSRVMYASIIPGEGKMTAQVLTLCKQPFTDIRVHAMLVVAVIGIQVWGQKELAANAGFVPWLLNRSSEACKESKEAKFDILKTLVKSPTTSKVFKAEDYLKMRADFKNGPFHVALAEEMQMEQVHS